VESLRERFGKYHVLSRIAQGGMAEVYKVKTVGIAGFEKVQALKRILPAQAQRARFIRSFIDEARIAVELNHRNIVQVFDFGKADGELYLAMELIEGKDLRTATVQARARGVPLPARLACHIVAEVAAGLDFAHRKTDELGRSLGIVHCDVSPANIMLSSDGYVKILDFGVARASFATELDQGRLRGKPRYMSPEQTEGAPTTAASDVFALGIVAWEILTGQQLFDGQSVAQILAAVRRAEAPRADRVNPAVPEAVAIAVAQALAVDPARRGSAADLAGVAARAGAGSGARALAAWLEDIDRQAPVPGAEAVDDLRAGTASVLAARASADAQRSSGVPVPVAIGVSAPASAAHPVGEVTGDTGDIAVPDARELAGIPRPIDPAPTRPMRGGVTEKVSWAAFGISDDDLVPDDDPATAVGPELVPDDDAAPALVDDPAQDDVSAAVAAASDADLDAAFDAAFDAALPGGDDLAAVLAGGAPGGDSDEAIDDDLGAPVPGGLPERRRAVVVALVVDTPGDARPVVISLGDLAYKRGGVVVDVDDRGAVIAFGIEIAGEDDVATAMAYAVDAGAAARDLDAAATVRIGARAGVAVPVGESAAPADDPRIPADALEEARQLAREAQPGRPLFAGGAGRVSAAHFAFRELPARRHLHHRGRLLEVTGPRSFDERSRALLDRRGRFVGRADALAELAARAARAAAGDHRVSVLIRGQAGTGKSRLVAEFAARAAAGPDAPLLVAVQASPAAQLAPFALVVDLFHAALDLPPGRGRAARARLVARLRHVLSKGGIGGAPAAALDRAMALRDGAALAPTQAADLRDQLAVAIATFRTALRAAGRPLVTVVEDLHQADAASLEVLALILASPAPGAELLLATARPEAAKLPGFDEVITLDDLVGAELDELVTDRLREAAAPAAVAAVIERAGGNPLFVEEVAAAVREAGPDVPATAQDVLAARFDRLSPPAKTLLQHAAVFGSTVRARLLDELVAGDLPAALEELTAEGLLVRTDHAAPEAAEGELGFARGLVREVVLASLSGRAQREAHARIGALLASRFHAGRDEPPAVIAEHLERGGALAGAAAFWLRAGRLALDAGSTDVAQAHFARVLDLEGQLGAEPPTAPSRARRRAAYIGRDDARRLRGDVGDDAGDLDALARLADGNPARLADVEIRRGERLVRIGAPGAVAAADRAAVLARRANDQRARGEALRLRGEALARRGRFAEAHTSFEQARHLLRRMGAQAEDAAALVGDAHVLVAQGRLGDAADALALILSRLGDRATADLERRVPWLEAELELARGDLPEAMAAGRRAVELARRHGDRAREGDALVLCGAAADELGLHDHAALELAEGHALLAASGVRHGLAVALVRTGVHQTRVGEVNAALATLGEALTVTSELAAAAVEVEARLARAEASLAAGVPAVAAVDAVAAVQAAAAVGMRGAEQRALARHAEALLRQGQAIEADPLSARAVALLDRAGAAPGAEAEILATRARVLIALGRGAEAAALCARARRVIVETLDLLDAEVWRRAFAAIPLHRRLLDGA
jgi:tetratricopeptide (TPR) repeat protein/tRNA A-37 threonylcarbamoyl transferase component Bud32